MAHLPDCQDMIIRVNRLRVATSVEYNRKLLSEPLERSIKPLYEQGIPDIEQLRIDSTVMKSNITPPLGAL